MSRVETIFATGPSLCTIAVAVAIICTMLWFGIAASTINVSVASTSSAIIMLLFTAIAKNMFCKKNTSFEISKRNTCAYDKWVSGYLATR